MKAKKSLGQHFLRSQKALSQIVFAADIEANDMVLEIGPGEGVLTERLIAMAGKVVAVEKDHELVAELQKRFDEAISDHRLEIVEGDILKFDPFSLKQSLKAEQRYKLVANIPYYITGAIIEQFLSTTYQPERMVLLMQKEVAERIIARDGKESVLSIAVKAYGKPRIIATVPPGAFAPAPTVDSAIVLIEGITRDFFKDIDEKLFFTVLKTIFGKKRKQIGGSLADFLADKEKMIATLAAAHIDQKTRPEDLDLETWKRLIHALGS